MNELSYLPVVGYFCAWEANPRSRPKKGRKQISFSDRYRLTGFIEIDGNRYRLQFAEYEDINAMFDGLYPTKPKMVSLYGTYMESIAQAERQMFSPVIDGEKGQIGVPVITTKGPLTLLPYVVLDRRGVRLEVTFKSLEADTGKTIDILSLKTEPGGIKMMVSDKLRWVWQPIRKAGGEIEKDAAA